MDIVIEISTMTKSFKMSMEKVIKLYNISERYKLKSNYIVKKNLIIYMKDYHGKDGLACTFSEMLKYAKT